MNLESWQRIRDVFDAVIDLPQDERETVLVRECGADPSLRRKVESLIECETGASLGRVIGNAFLSVTQNTDPLHIGNYRIIRRLGEGGMGVVYEAEQSHPRRKVAIKLLRLGRLAADRDKRLFEREAEALGRLDHGGIGRIYESGLTDEGQPYLVMEFVAGETLSSKLKREGGTATFKRAAVRERLLLFLKICEAITYAHQRGVIHRDLKPSNIMMSEGHVKVLDFGLARIADRGDFGLTETGVVQGSLRYMSPEQARGEGSRIDVRSDIYSLGVVLYEMLAGQHPYLGETTDVLVAGHRICQIPMKPLRALGKPVNPDLDTILAKAMEKDQERRYESVAAFASDLRRYLDNRTILARPTSTLYQVRKLIARNRLASASIALLMLLVFGFGVTAVVQSSRIRQERDRANQEAATARQVSDFLVNLFRETNPVQTDGELTAKDHLRAGYQRLKSDLKDTPELRARLLDNIGSAFNAVGPFDEAKGVFEESLRIRGADSPAASNAWVGLGNTYYNQGKYRESVDAIRKALEIDRLHLPAQDDRIVTDMDSLAQSLGGVGSFREAASIYGQIEELDRKWKRENTEDAAVRLANYGDLLRKQGSYAEAIAKLQLAVSRLDKRRNPLKNAAIWNDLGQAFNSSNRFGEAEAALRRAESMAIKVFGPDAANTGIVQLNIAYSLLGAKKWPEAERQLEKARLALDGKLPASHPTWSDVWGAWAKVKEGQDLPREAEQFWRRATEISIKALGPDHARTLATRKLRAQNLKRLR